MSTGSGSVELGTRFSVDADGLVTALRFYKVPGTDGAHVVSLWTASGTLLATTTPIAEAASGWQQVELPAPIAISAHTYYVVSYYTASGEFGYTLSYFSTPYDNAPLHAPADSGGTPNGVYVYGGGGAFPTNTFGSTSYFSDLCWEPGPTPTPVVPPIFVPNTLTPTITPTSGATATPAVPPIIIANTPTPFIALVPTHHVAVIQGVGAVGLCIATPAPGTPAPPYVCIQPAVPTPTPRIALAEFGHPIEIPDLGHALVRCTPGLSTRFLCRITPTPGSLEASLGLPSVATAYDVTGDFGMCSATAQAFVCALP